jgi:hypothetical protein
VFGTPLGGLTRPVPDVALNAMIDVYHSSAASAAVFPEVSRASDVPISQISYPPAGVGLQGWWLVMM